MTLPAHTTVVAVTRTFPGGANGTAADFDAWLRTRFETATIVLEQNGLPLETARFVARAFLIMWWREIGPQRDKAEFNFNVGNIKCMGTPDPVNGPWRGYCHVLSDGLAYRAYQSLSDGIADYVRVLRGDRYQPAMAYLIANPRDGVGWYRRLVEAGYSEGSPDEAASDFRSIDTALYNHFSKAS